MPEYEYSCTNDIFNVFSFTPYPSAVFIKTNFSTSYFLLHRENNIKIKYNHSLNHCLFPKFVFYVKIEIYFELGVIDMEKILFCNLDLLKISFDSRENLALQELRNQFLQYAKELYVDEENKIYFISRDQNLLYTAEEHFIKKEKITYLNFRQRDKARDFVMKNRDRNHRFVFIGGKEVDFLLAVHTHSLFIVPTWIPVEEKAKHYGISVDTPAQLFQFIRTLNNQESWYAKASIEPNITAFSLMDGRYKCKAWTNNEKEMVEHFELLLKSGSSRNYYHILLYHFLAGMTNSNLFDDIELFGMIPSSDCTLNDDILSFMWQTRIIKGKRNPQTLPNGENLILRKLPKAKAHNSYTIDYRANMGAIDEFETICINPDFKNKINTLKKTKNFNVCIFDDYMTHGNSFNAVRNLLKNLGANKIIFVSLGNFGRPFQKKDYTITGNIFDTGYSYSLTNSNIVPLSYNSAAKNEVAELYNIFNS